MVGVGSVGTRCWLALFVGGDNDDPLFLQIKQAEASVLERFTSKSTLNNHGQRVVEGQRIMQAASDIFLGWQRLDAPEGGTRDFYVRQLWDWKFSAVVDTMEPEVLEIYAGMCAWTLARAHARSGDAVSSPVTWATAPSSTGPSPTSPWPTPTRTRSTTGPSSTPSPTAGWSPSRGSEPDGPGITVGRGLHATRRGGPPLTIDLVLIGLACSLEPIPLTGFILTLSTDHGRRKGLFFLAGWIVSLAVVIGLTLALTDGKPPAASTAPSEGILVAKIVVGAALIVFAWRYRRRAPKEHAPPAWAKRIDHMNVWTAAVLAFLLQPWGLVAAGALSISEADTSKTGDVLAIIAFVFLATVSLLVMEVYAFVNPEAAQARLDGLRQWMNDHRAEVIVYLSVVVGLWLIGKSAYALAT